MSQYYHSVLTMSENDGLGGRPSLYQVAYFCILVNIWILAKGSICASFHLPNLPTTLATSLRRRRKIQFKSPGTESLGLLS